MAPQRARARAHGLIPAEVLAHVPGASTAGSAWATPLAGGTVNSTFRVETSAGRFVVRIHHPVAASLGANHEREARLHAAAAAAGLAPALLHVDADHRFMVMEHIPGSTWTAMDFSDAQRLGQLGATLHALHAVPAPPVASFDVEIALVKHYERLNEALPEEAPRLERLMQRATAALQESGAWQRPKVLVHNDLYHSNLLGRERLYLLDWEYAAVADPLFDLACVLAYYPQAGAHAQGLLDASGLASHASLAMLRAGTWVFVLLSYFWYRARRLAGAVSEHELETERNLLARLG